MIFILLEPADDRTGQAPVVFRNGKPLLDSKIERRLRLVAGSIRQGIAAKQLDIRIQKSFLWLICFVVVNPVNSESRAGECVIGIRRTPWTWVQRKLRLLDKRVTDPISAAGFQIDFQVRDALVAIWKGKVNANHTTTR